MFLIYIWLTCNKHDAANQGITILFTTLTETCDPQPLD